MWKNTNVKNIGNNKYKLRSKLVKVLNVFWSGSFIQDYSSVYWSHRFVENGVKIRAEGKICSCVITALIRSWAFIRVSGLVLDFPHHSPEVWRLCSIHQALGLLSFWQLKFLPFESKEKGNEYGSPAQRRRRDGSSSSESTFSKSLEAQRSFYRIDFPILSLVWNIRGAPNVGPKVLKMQSPVSPGCWTPATSGTVEKLVVTSLVPCLTDHASFHCIWAERRGDRKGLSGCAQTAKWCRANI